MPLRRFHVAHQRRPLRGDDVETFVLRLANGVELLEQKRGDEGRPVLVSVRLPAAWSVARARSWLRRHGRRVDSLEPAEPS